MYQVVRENGRVIIYDWNEKPVFNVSEQARVLYRSDLKNEIRIETVKDMSDDKLLVSLANAVTFQL